MSLSSLGASLFGAFMDPTPSPITDDEKEIVATVLDRVVECASWRSAVELETDTVLRTEAHQRRIWERQAKAAKDARDRKAAMEAQRREVAKKQKELRAARVRAREEEAISKVGERIKQGKRKPPGGSMRFKGLGRQGTAGDDDLISSINGSIASLERLGTGEGDSQLYPSPRTSLDGGLRRSLDGGA
eukprot:CAMPEP_0182861286 /NCGR_PEP_ID=MMETSP0034_2-20130328/5407_1 /TAXON_ID=156128 /ORGANISM="Nephroselmis pyriformis, Strain CCMP717" /LENGTH=187 /DNA_ID=CAMNT_0024993197 /DNA_START=217 /DNA_END=777 /DNA_ORIENTATION=+